ncbi:hypothetical protein [Massilia sp. BJB1822]|uniref:hypothetical protein n=1 Tax=Massilia sp. BJB1822 TaxID=2744470 RepID=UPI001594D46E|nr:hypothetical protein [Massilia sp. BJB1822]NVE01739.1 hypothetical protein [Massilia sp. BJB1822]
MERNHHNPAQAVVSVADVNERRLEKHRPVARALRGGAAAGADEVLALAHAQIALWERGHLCSQDYIDAWKELLQHPLRAAQILEERSPRAAALRQNSPFVASVRKFQTLANAA